ncbi:hypothetical protein DERF_006839 [Dermatophagoides farinae]|uniref:Transmembrane protein n=1 Tax=Dermatophagoides farinae TaxID=6954 RepID=A0A922HXX2_DERFA|nr:hypothetical protein HUG17_1393 [Dermatophagoides farinae]KAH9516078.1 hypothetical protein DERF_006839 [Dermatophagoides farinae]
MYGLYLKYFHRNDNVKDERRNSECQLEQTKASFPKNLKNESKPFQLIFFTVTGGSAGMLLFFLVYPIRRIYQSSYGIFYNRNILVDKIVRPFCLTTLASYFVSFAAGVAFISYNSQNDNQKFDQTKN